MSRLVPAPLTMLEHLLYRHRPDLWSVTRVFMHCRGKVTDNLRTLCWQGLAPEDKDLLNNLKKGKVPSAWTKTLAE